jgi:hypothetical protein
VAAKYQRASFAVKSSDDLQTKIACNVGLTQLAARVADAAARYHSHLIAMIDARNPPVPPQQCH